MSRSASPTRLGIALAAVVLAFAIELAIPQVFRAVPFMLFYAAVMWAVWFSGPRAGLTATALSALLAQGWIVPGRFAAVMREPDTALRLFGFLLVCTFLVLLAHRLSAGARQLAGNEQRLLDERTRLERALNDLKREQDQLAQAHGQLQVQAEELEVTAEELKAQSDELQQTERQLRKQLALTSAITASLHEGLYAIDRQGCCTFINPAAEQLLGWTRGELLGRSMHESIHYQRVDGSAYPVDECPSTRVLQSGVPQRVDDEVFTRRDGTRLAVAYSAAPLLADGEVSGVVVAFADVTARRQAEQEREQLLAAERSARDAAERERARTVHVLETIHEGFFDMDRSMRYRYVNRRGAHLFGLTPEAMVGHTMFELFPDARSHPAYAVLERAIATKEPVTFEQYYAPVDLWFEAQLYPDVDGMVVFMRDIGERKRAEAALREREERLRLAVEAGQMGMWDWEPRTGRLVWSPRLEEIFGLQSGSFDGTFEQFMGGVHPDDREAVLAEIARSAERGGEHYIKHRVQLADGRVRWVEGRGRAFLDADGKAGRMVGVTLDVTEREERARELERMVQERSAALTEIINELEAFSYSVSHDLRAPIRAMRGFADAILDEPGDDGPHDYARRIAQSADHMDTLIQDLLSYSRMSRASMEPQPVGVRPLLDEVMTHMPGMLDHARIHIQVGDDVPLVRGHRSTLMQVLTNLISNAVKFVAPDVTPEVTVRAETRGRAVRVWVEDNGIGIAPRYHDRIFHVFERLNRGERYPGTGVGLAIVRRGMERMGGSSGVESEPGKGSRFWVELPRAS